MFESRTAVDHHQRRAGGVAQDFVVEAHSRGGEGLARLRGGRGPGGDRNGERENGGETPRLEHRSDPPAQRMCGVIVSLLRYSERRKGARPCRTSTASITSRPSPE